MKNSDIVITLVSPRIIKLLLGSVETQQEIIEPAIQLPEPPNLICKMPFGSRLYGTATENSDLDFKGIFLPTMEDVYLGRIPKTFYFKEKNIDLEYYSLHHFLKLATQGQTVAIDMLFAPPGLIDKSTEFGWIWDEIIKHRRRFLSKNMNAFTGYARAQASKYSLKGERLNKLHEFIESIKGLTLLRDAWDQLPKDSERINPQGIRELQIAGKWFGESTSIENVNQSISKLIKRYGERTKAASEAGGVDWKALSHAVRVSKELIELLSFGQVNFPLADASLLLAIKSGQRSLENVQNILDRDLAFIELQSQQSHLPEKVDMTWWDNKLIEIIKNCYGYKT